MRRKYAWRSLEPKIATVPLVLTVATVGLCTWLLLEQLPVLAHSNGYLATIATVPQRGNIYGYQRDAFGHGWQPTGIGSCTTREAIIYDQLHNDHTMSFQQWCTTPAHLREPLRGPDLYSDRSIATEPHGQEAAIEVDHIFPLRAAWDLGAVYWDEATRVAFANDPRNLVAVSKQENREKSDQLPSKWLPPLRAQRCWYVNRLAEVASIYQLNLSESDVAVMHKQCILG